MSAVTPTLCPRCSCPTDGAMCPAYGCQKAAFRADVLHWIASLPWPVRRMVRASIAVVGLVYLVAGGR